MPQEISLVALEGIVALKILRHYDDTSPDTLLGSLMGLMLEADKTLEITECFPVPLDLSKEERLQFQAQIVKSFQPNVDKNITGWYCTPALGIKEIITRQKKAQQSGYESVLLMVKPNSGIPSIHAYVLSDNYMKCVLSDRWTKDSLLKNGVTFSDVLREIPIKIHNNCLVTAFLKQFERKNKKTFTDFSALNISPLSRIEKNIQGLSESLDTLNHENSKFSTYSYQLQKVQNDQQNWLAKQQTQNLQRKEENLPLLSTDLSDCPIKLPGEIKRVDALHCAFQIRTQSLEINETCENSLSKYYLTFQKL